MLLPYRIAARILNTLGIEVVSAWPYTLLCRQTDTTLREASLEQFLYRNALAKLLKETHVNCVFDVGANLGQYASLLRELGYKGYIISFEPVRELYERLNDLSGADPKWQIYQCGLGRNEGVQSIHQTTLSVLSSFLTPNNYAREHFRGAQEVIAAESVEIRRLDSILKTIDVPVNEPRFFLKLDTQGYDLEAFAGLGSEGNKFVGLQSEVSAVPLYEKMPHMTEAIRLYEASGFRSLGFFPISRDNKTSHVIEYDCLMIRATAS